MFQDHSRHASLPSHEVALDCLAAGINAAHPSAVVRDRIGYNSDADTATIDDAQYDFDDVANVYVVGGGNAAGAIARAVEETLGDRIADGAVVTDAPRETRTVETLPGDHPVPSERGVESTVQVRDLAAGADENDLVLALIGGGGSALMVSPAEGVPLAALRDLTDRLLESGATIGEINAVRKHLSTFKGGQLARVAAPARVVGLIFSDVVGDDLSVIASGPTAPDETTYEEALEVLERYDVDVPEPARTHLERGASGDVSETPGPDSEVFDRVRNHVIANGMTALRAASDEAKSQGYTPLILSSRMRGESREIATAHVAIAEECAASAQPVDPPAVLLSGGETTVTVRGDGTGGPNQEFALQGAVEMSEPIVVGSVDTDGLDGSTDAAGALVDGDTVDDRERARRALDGNDAYPILDDRDALLFTGETGTNVNDIRVLVVEG